MATQSNKSSASLSQAFSEAAKKRIHLQQTYTFNRSRQRFYNYHIVVRQTEVQLVSGIKDVFRKPEKVSNSGVTWYPESMEYLFKLNGGAKQLFLYIVFYELDIQTGEFSYTQLFRDRFLDYAQTFGIKPQEDTMYKQLRSMVDANIFQNVAYQRYMLNPMIAGGGSMSQRDELIKEYSRKLSSNNNKCAFDDFYPRY